MNKPDYTIRMCDDSSSIDEIINMLKDIEKYDRSEDEKYILHLVYDDVNIIIDQIDIDLDIITGSECAHFVDFGKRKNCIDEINVPGYSYDMHTTKNVISECDYNFELTYSNTVIYVDWMGKKIIAETELIMNDVDGYFSS